MSDSDLTKNEVAMQASSHPFPLEPPPRITSRSCEDAPGTATIATPEVNATINFGGKNAKNREQRAWTPDRSTEARMDGRRSFDIQHFDRNDRALGRRDSGPDASRVDHGARSNRGPATSGRDAESPDATAETLTPTNPHAEGRRARAAGLTEAENPYLWPPGAREDWAAGWMGEAK
jgi:hypothetical protein